jgi:hypothetical protein
VAMRAEAEPGAPLAAGDPSERRASASTCAGCATQAPGRGAAACSATTTSPQRRRLASRR